MRNSAIRREPDHETEDTAKLALVELLAHLRALDYKFVTPTPATHARVVAHADRQVGQDLRDLFGWSVPVPRGNIAPALLAILDAAGVLCEQDGLVRSLLRVSSLRGDLFLHSAYPTDDEDAVFFGPDSYRFARLIAHEVGSSLLGDGAHIGTGAGVGVIVAGKGFPSAKLTMTDINPAALRLASVNACAAEVTARAVVGATLDGVDCPVDLALANPPYIIDSADRDYRDGGAMHGGEVALDMARMAVERLAPGGRLILYTGSAIVGGADPLEEALTSVARAARCTMRYRETRSRCLR